MAAAVAPAFAHDNYERMILISANEYADLLDCKKHVRFRELEEDEPAKNYVKFADPMVETRLIPDRFAEAEEDDETPRETNHCKSKTVCSK